MESYDLKHLAPLIMVILAVVVLACIKRLNDKERRDRLQAERRFQADLSRMYSRRSAVTPGRQGHASPARDNTTPSGAELSMFYAADIGCDKTGPTDTGSSSCGDGGGGGGD